MIGVAFGLEGTLVTSTGLEAAARSDLRATLNVDDATLDAALSAAAPDRSQRNLRAAYRQRLTAFADRFIVLDPDAAEVLEALQGLKMPVAILSNASSGVLARTCDLIAFRGHTLCAEDIGAAIPEPGAFAAVSAALMLPSERIWFVSRLLEREIVPAHACGFRTIYIAGETSPDTLPDTTVWASTLRDVLDIIGESYTRSALALRYMMRTALQWRPGHVMEPQDD